MQETKGRFLGQIKKALSFSNINKNIDKQEAKKLKRRSSLMTLDPDVNNQRILEEENARFDEVSYASLVITSWSSVARIMQQPLYFSGEHNFGSHRSTKELWEHKTLCQQATYFQALQTLEVVINLDLAKTTIQCPRHSFFKSLWLVENAHNFP